MALPAKEVLLAPANYLIFRGPFNDQTRALMVLGNCDEYPYAFKIKCTNNARFRINPAVGILLPNYQIGVEVMCTAFEYPAGANRPDQFIIETTYATEENAANVFALKPPTRSRMLKVGYLP